MVLRAPKPWIEVWLDSKDVSLAVAPYWLELTYVDHLDGKEPDALELLLEDRGRIFQGPRYPRRGDAMRFRFGMDSGPIFDSRLGFRIDEIEVSGPPDTVRLRAIATQPQGTLHQRASQVWKDITLEEIARSVAAKHGLEVLVDGEGLVWKRMTQLDETDLGFLRRLGREHGLVVSVKAGAHGPVLHLGKRETLEGRSPILELQRDQVSRFDFRSKIEPGERGSYTRWFDSSLKELVEFEVPRPERPAPDLKGQGGALRQRTRVEGPRHAEVNARRTLREKKGDEHEATFTLPGDPRVRAGVNLLLPAESWSALQGTYQVTTSRHTLTRRGYEAQATTRRIR